MNTAKKTARWTASACEQAGIQHVVICPGSRSAPLVMAFTNNSYFKCYAIPDERVAGYFALGLAQQLGQPVAVICTSGTAVLNLAPAVCEAYYQFVPLLILTADRPGNLQGQGENQTIQQANIFQNYVAHSASLPDEELFTATEAASVLSVCINKLNENGPLPVHLNIEFSEPLYKTIESTEEIVPHIALSNHIHQTATSFDETLLKGKKLIVAGMHAPDTKLSNHLENLATRVDTTIIAEHLSNINIERGMYFPDAVLAQATNEKLKELQPDVLITIGKQFISKRLRQFLKQHPPVLHIHLHQGNTGWNFTERDHDHYVDVPLSAFSFELLTALPQSENNYQDSWQKPFEKHMEALNTTLLKEPFNELSGMQTIIKQLPGGTNIHYGNSSPVRLASFFHQPNNITINSNRGTSGIDGCLSTAVGASQITEGLTVCLLGDVSFFYDSNALWNYYLKPELRVIVFNNGGGNIFSLIDGPSNWPSYKPYFNTPHQLSAKHLASMYGLGYYICGNMEELEKTLLDFFVLDDKPKLLEVTFDPTKTTKAFKAYYQYLKNKKI